jgi:hypothetical protein
VKPGRISNDRGHERRRWNHRDDHCGKRVTPDPSVQSPILPATGDQQAHSEPGECAVRQASDPYVRLVVSVSRIRRPQRRRRAHTRRSQTRSPCDRWRRTIGRRTLEISVRRGETASARPATPQPQASVESCEASPHTSAILPGS